VGESTVWARKERGEAGGISRENLLKGKSAGCSALHRAGNPPVYVGNDRY